MHTRRAHRLTVILAALLLGCSVALADRQLDPWRQAIRKSDTRTLYQLAGPNANVNARGIHGKTALMLAAARDDRRLIARLVELGADVNQQNRAGGTALMYAGQHGHIDAAQLLIDNGADVNHRGGKGWTALMVAVLKARAAMVELLLANGADPNTRDVLAWTPLMRASHSGHTAVVPHLLNAPETDVNARNRSGQTALHLAAMSGQHDIAGLLLGAGANAQIKDLEGNSPMAVAQKSGHDEVVRLLRSRSDAGSN